MARPKRSVRRTAPAGDGEGIPLPAKVMGIVALLALLAFGFNSLVKLARDRELVQNIARHPAATGWWEEIEAWAAEAPASRAVWYGPIVRDVWANPNSPDRTLYGFEMEGGKCVAGRPSEHDAGSKIYLDMPESGEPILDPIPTVDEQWVIAVERDENDRNVIVSGVLILAP